MRAIGMEERHLRSQGMSPEEEEARSAVAVVWASAEEGRQRHGALSRQNGARSGGGRSVEEGEAPHVRDFALSSLFSTACV